MNTTLVKLGALSSLLCFSGFGVSAYLMIQFNSFAFGVIGQILFFAGSFSLIFGVFAPLAGGVMYRHYLTDVKRKQLAGFAIWRLILNINSREEDGNDN